TRCMRSATNSRQAPQARAACIFFRLFSRHRHLAGRTTIGANSKPFPLIPMHRIALVMIVRNEARCIARCLRSVKPWVDEMIVLDTGSADDTVALARAEGARVHSAPWQNDFSLARNAALDLSEADWNLVLDADETLSEGGPALQALRETAPDFLGRIDVRSEYASAGGQTASAPGTERQ